MVGYYLFFCFCCYKKKFWLVFTSSIHPSIHSFIHSFCFISSYIFILFIYFLTLFCFVSHFRFVYYNSVDNNNNNKDDDRKIKIQNEMKKKTMLDQLKKWSKFHMDVDKESSSKRQQKKIVNLYLIHFISYMFFIFFCSFIDLIAISIY